MLLETLRSQRSNRRFPDWQPEPTNARSNLPANVVVVLRRLCLLRDLEIQVGDWIDAARKEANSDEIVELLQKNIDDEQKHAQTIDYLNAYINSQPTETEQAHARVVKSYWSNNLPQTFASAYALEMGVFFTVLPWMVRNGDVYTTRVSQWISDDEAVHVRNHLTMAKHLQQKLTDKHVTAIKATLQWLFYDALGRQETSRLIDRALLRLRTGKDPAMNDESVPVTVAMFEQKDKRKIVY